MGGAGGGLRLPRCCMLRSPRHGMLTPQSLRRKRPLQRSACGTQWRGTWEWVSNTVVEQRPLYRYLDSWTVAGERVRPRAYVRPAWPASRRL